MPTAKLAILIGSTFLPSFCLLTSKPRGLCMFVIGFHACPLEAGSYGCGEAIVPSAWWLGPGSFADRSIPCQYRQQDLTSSGKIILLSELWGECSVLTARITFFSHQFFGSFWFEIVGNCNANICAGVLNHLYLFEQPHNVIPVASIVKIAGIGATLGSEIFQGSCLK